MFNQSPPDAGLYDAIRLAFYKLVYASAICFHAYLLVSILNGINTCNAL